MTNFLLFQGPVSLNTKKNFADFGLMGCMTGLPCSSDSKEFAYGAGNLFDPWVRKISWRREWLPTPVFLPGESHGQRSTEGYSPWVAKSRT